jgi:hypothetical protein
VDLKGKKRKGKRGTREGNRKDERDTAILAKEARRAKKRPSPFYNYEV